MSQGMSCKCGKEFLAVVCKGHNHSAFNGYHRTSSGYSDIECNKCGSRWRTNAAYVCSLPLKNGKDCCHLI